MLLQWTGVYYCRTYFDYNLTFKQAFIAHCENYHQFLGVNFKLFACCFKEITGFFFIYLTCLKMG